MDGRREGSLGRKILTLDGREGHSRQQTPSNRSALNRSCSQQTEGAASARQHLLGAKKDNCNVHGEQSTISSNHPGLLSSHH